MAKNYKHSGKTIRVLTASTGGLVSGIPCVQEGFFGIALDTVLVGEAADLAISGVWNIAVPASTVKGDLLYVPSSAGGVALTEDNDVVAQLTRTSSNANAPVVVAIEDRRADGTADCLILPRAASRAATQV